MGWTGMYHWNSWEKNSEILEREFFGSAEHKYESVQWSNKGGHTWCLYKHKETNLSQIFHIYRYIPLFYFTSQNYKKYLNLVSKPHLIPH